MRARIFALGLLCSLTVGPWGLACTPTCTQVCDKLIACENEGTERMSSAECSEQCTKERDLYKDWTDLDKREAFDDELSCLYDSSCEEVADEVCYDPQIWSY